MLVLFTQHHVSFFWGAHKYRTFKQASLVVLLLLCDETLSSFHSLRCSPASEPVEVRVASASEEKVTMRGIPAIPLCTSFELHITTRSLAEHDWRVWCAGDERKVILSGLQKHDDMERTRVTSSTTAADRLQCRPIFVVKQWIFEFHNPRSSILTVVATLRSRRMSLWIWWMRQRQFKGRAAIYRTKSNLKNWHETKFIPWSEILARRFFRKQQTILKCSSRTSKASTILVNHQGNFFLGKNYGSRKFK